MASPPSQPTTAIEPTQPTQPSSSDKTLATLEDPEVESAIVEDAEMADNQMEVDGAEAGEGEARVPGLPKVETKKDKNLRAFLGMMDDYAPIVCFVTVTSLSSSFVALDYD